MGAHVGKSWAAKTRAAMYNGHNSSVAINSNAQSNAVCSAHVGLQPVRRNGEEAYNASVLHEYNVTAFDLGHRPGYHLCILGRHGRRWKPGT